ncbi:hypothetical protein PE36_00105 [Moritella sp. PE36]|uniref:P27 family phage terminase small subunit n=1 Tax=Moritella sp. PE36 TaxID=58051 RepID=UPI0001569276|nr:P27 family phage terminase small subunit [Moritella sp. PE36]EDM66152.1 hypothetical protein PE36_00105 [Moritella sp. PE36]
MESYPIEIKGKKQKKVYDYFLKIYVEVVGDPTLSNREAIGSYAVLFIEIDNLKKFLAREGNTYDSDTDRGNVSVKARPEVNQLDKMEARLFQMKKQLGFYQNSNVKDSPTFGGLEQFMT